MRALLINVHDRIISDVEVVSDDSGSQLKSMYSLIGCDLVAVAANIPTQNPKHFDSIYVDDEGLHNPNLSSFVLTCPAIYPNPQTFVGNGLVLGLDSYTGESIDVSMALYDLATMIDWI